MYKTILLVSRDERLQETQALVLRQGRYHTMSATNMTSALQLAGRCQMSIIGHTFTPHEQDEFIDRVHESISACSNLPPVFIDTAAGAIESG
jgi:DNA-binding response OmpR family regulator